MPLRPRNLRKRRFGVFLSVTAVAALVLRLAVSWQLAGYHGGRNAVLAPAEQTDLATYMRLAGEVAAGRFTGEFDYQPFYYAVFLPALRLLFGDSAWAVIVVQALLGAATVALAGRIAARLGGGVAGGVAAVLTALASTLVLYTPFHAIVTVMTFWLTLTLLTAIRAADTRRWRWFILSGVAAGCAILTRGNFYLLLPALLAVAWCRSPRSGGWPRRLAQTAAVLGLVFLVQLPFIWHNTAVTGRLTGASTAGGKVLALGNTPEAPPGGRNPGLPAGPMEYPETWDIWMAGEAEYPIYRRVLDWFLEEPGAVIELNFRKALLFWDYREIPNNIGFSVDPELGLNIQGEAEQASCLALAAVPTGLLLTLGLAGMFLLAGRAVRRRSWALGLAYCWVILYWLATALFYILARFRAPLLPTLAVFAGLFVAELYRRRRTLRREWARPALALLGAAFLVFCANDLYRACLEAPVLRLVKPDGVHQRTADGRELRLDNGPASFGGWTPLPLERGMVLNKTFAAAGDGGASGDGGGAELEVAFQAAGPGRAVLSIDGMSRTESFAAPGFYTRRIPLPRLPDDGVTIRVAAVTGELYLTVDRQRDYRRTRVNGEPQPFELVARLYYQPAETSGGPAGE